MKVIEFFVTGLGVVLDNRGVLPGSTLLLKQQPPSHWSRFGTTDAKEAEKRMEVATPKATSKAEAKAAADEAKTKAAAKAAPKAEAPAGGMPPPAK